MPRSSHRRKQDRSLSSSRIWFLGTAAIFLAVAVGTLKWLETDPGRIFLAELGIDSARGWAEAHLGEAVEAGLQSAPVDSLRWRGREAICTAASDVANPAATCSSCTSDSLAISPIDWSFVGGTSPPIRRRCLEAVWHW